MRRTILVLGLCVMATAAQAQPPGGGGGQRPTMTPEQQAAIAAKRQAETSAPRPIEALDSVWMEELTWIKVRDAIKEGNTTALILTGGVESNGPYLATGKHKYNGNPTRFHYIAEYYDYTSVQKMLQDNGIAEQIKLGASSGSDGIHDEYGIDALMALYDPEQHTNRAAQEGQPHDDQRREPAAHGEDARDG